ncbi:unnamed protein product, partial [Ascophyllum nodosum]
ATATWYLVRSNTLILYTIISNDTQSTYSTVACDNPFNTSCQSHRSHFTSITS